MIKIFIWIFAVLAFIFIAARQAERNNLYFPARELHADPSAVGLPYEEIYFTTSDNKELNGWFIPADKLAEPSHPKRLFTVLFCHGNGGNISYRLEKLLSFHKLGLNTFIFDYRGYGKSKGGPSEKGFYRDASAAYSYLIEKRGIPKDSIIPFGESLGGAVAINLAQEKGVRALITEDVFPSVTDMAKIYYPFIPPFFIREKFDSLSKIKNVKCPKLMIHSLDDEIVPFYLGERLFNAANPPKKFLKTRGLHNSSFFNSREYIIEAIRIFLKELQD